jgi:hypothetical protein
MPLQNRVAPTGEIVADPARGTLIGNRGILHDEIRRLGTARWRHPHWIACRLDFRGRRRAPMSPGRYTELFFLDEAVALAAGHRPCGECRSEALARFRAAWQRTHGTAPRAAELDRLLHAARLRPGSRGQRRMPAPLDDLPDGTFVLVAGRAMLVLGDHLLPYAPAGYGPPAPRHRGDTVEVLTPMPVVAVLAAGYRPEINLGAAPPRAPAGR